MPLLLVNCMASRHFGRSTKPIGLQKYTRSRSSFIKQVMEQVRRDAEKNPDIQKAKQELSDKTSSLSDSQESLRKKAAEQEQKLRIMADMMKEKSQKTKGMFTSMKNKISFEKFDDSASSNPYIQAFKENHWPKISAKISSVTDQAKVISTKAVDGTQKWVSQFSGSKEEKDTVKDRLSAWQQTREKERFATRIKKEKEDRGIEEFEVEENVSETPQHPHGQALVVSNKGNSTWDRFGFSAESMPLLHYMYDSPVFDRIFGETEIAQSLREMKDIDSGFRLAEFADEIEHIVAPQVVKWYLEGDKEALARHCGEAAFAAINASIKARQKEKLWLDPNILAGPSELELKGAKAGQDEVPCFIFTFATQQINCLRDEDGGIVEGAVDDIRQVFYAMAVRRHPEINNHDVELAYPWQVQELAILGNQPSW